MEVTQNSPKSDISTPVKELIPVPWTELSPQQQYYVDYCVLQGVITADDGTYSKMSLEQFSRQIGVDRKTLFNWKKAIPNFWDLVTERRKTVNSGARLNKVWNALFLASTVKLDVRAIQTYLANADDNFHMPMQEVKHEAGNSWAALIAQHAPVEAPEVIEGEVVDDAN